jgi:hypothetical protein
LETNPTREDWIRLAAFIDGEGSILINERNTQGKSNWGPWLRVVIANTDPRLPRWLRMTFGGGAVVARRRAKANHRHAIKWHVSCRQAEEILRNCLPFLLLKKEQAEIALAYRETIGGPGKRVSLEVMEKRKEYRARLVELRKQIFAVDDIRMEVTRDQSTLQ